MAGMQIKINDEYIDNIPVVQAGVNDGYWEDLARMEIKAVYILGMIDALKSIRSSYGVTGSALSNSIKLRLKQLQAEFDKNTHTKASGDA